MPRSRNLHRAPALHRPRTSHRALTVLPHRGRLIKGSAEAKRVMAAVRAAKHSYY